MEDSAFKINKNTPSANDLILSEKENNTVNPRDRQGGDFSPSAFAEKEAGNKSIQGVLNKNKSQIEKEMCSCSNRNVATIQLDPCEDTVCIPCISCASHCLVWWYIICTFQPYNHYIVCWKARKINMYDFTLYKLELGCVTEKNRKVEKALTSNSGSKR